MIMQQMDGKQITSKIYCSLTAIKESSLIAVANKRRNNETLY